MTYLDSNSSAISLGLSRFVIKRDNGDKSKKKLEVDKYQIYRQPPIYISYDSLKYISDDSVFKINRIRQKKKKEDTKI